MPITHDQAHDLHDQAARDLCRINEDLELVAERKEKCKTNLATAKYIHDLCFEVEQSLN